VDEEEALADLEAAAQFLRLEHFGGVGIKQQIREMLCIIKSMLSGLLLGRVEGGCSALESALALVLIDQLQSAFIYSYSL
jgi:hypothetical protein